MYNLRSLLILFSVVTLLPPLTSPLHVASHVPGNTCNCSFVDPDGIYYVTPANSSTDMTDCPSNDTCHPLRCYLSCTCDYMNATGENISMVLLPGYHLGLGQEATISVGSLTLTSAMNGAANVSSLKIVLLVRTALTIENITSIESSFSLSHYQEAFVMINNCQFLDSNVSLLSIGHVHIVNSLFNRTHILALSDLSATVVDLSIAHSTFNASEIIVQTARVFVKNCMFVNSLKSALTLFSSELTLAGKVSFLNNSGINGGALALIGTRLNIGNNSSIHFMNNSAKRRGGALFINYPGILIDVINHDTMCFYKLLEFAGDESLYFVEFTGNTAGRTGHHIYGASLRSPCIAAVYEYDSHKVASYELVNRGVFELNDPSYGSYGNDLSAVSGNPSRLCICDSGQPMCTNASMINITGINVYPGEIFTVSAILVGSDFGATPGTIETDISFPDSGGISFASESMNEQLITSNQCTQLEYSLNQNNTMTVDSVVLSFITVGTDLKTVPDNIVELCANFKDVGVIDPQLVSTPVAMHITVRPCPLGFTLTDGICNCYPAIRNLASVISCSVHKGIGYILRNSSRWIGINENDHGESMNDIIIIGRFCRRCKRELLNFSFQLDADFQCLGNHAGRLCGGCKEGFSLTLGSSNCRKCSNAYQVLWIVFMAAGIILVLVVSLLNLTVTQGKINGLVFYANIIWSHQDIFFPQGLDEATNIVTLLLFWLNLDFGIQICFIDGLTAFWKNWLQFLFPIYTAALFFIGVRFSSKLSVIFGDRTVPTLATLFFLSYAKLLRACITALSFSNLFEYNAMRMVDMKHVKRVWSADGNMDYAGSYHNLLFSAAILCLVLLWFPYVALLFSMQWLRRIDHHGPLKLIVRFKPFFDAYFGSLKDKHHYWFGVLLLVQGFLHLMSSLTLDTCPKVNKILVLFSVLMLLLYLNCVQVYKKRYIVLLESSFLINLALLFTVSFCSDFRLSSYFLNPITVSSGVAFFELIGIAIWNLIEDFRRMYKQRKAARCKQTASGAQELIDIAENQSKLSTSDFHKFRDSILIT